MKIDMARKSTDNLRSELMAAPDLTTFLAANEDNFSSASAVARLNEMLEKKGLSKAALAKQSGMSEIYLHQIFAGRRNPSRSRMLCLCFGDKGGSYLHFDNSFFVFVGRKLEHSHRAFTGGVPGNGSLRKLPHDVHGGLSVCLLFRGRIELSLVRVKFDDRSAPLIHRVKHNVARRRAGRKCKTQHCRMLSRCDLHLDIGGCGIIRIEGHAVIIRLGDLIFMTENRASILDGIT